MRIVVDTNIVFSAILNTNSAIARIFLLPKPRLNFYSTEQLLLELNRHKDKIQKLSNYSDADLKKIILLFISRIKFINIGLIPLEIYRKAENLTTSVDIDDTEYVALAEHIKGKLWSGDKELRKGLIKQRWNRFVTTDELIVLLTRKK